MGRGLELTETGRQFQAYADEIFSLGMELVEMVRNFPSSRPLVFEVGVADLVPRSIAYRLLTELALHRVDLVIADGPIPASVRVRGFNHHLGECGISFFTVPQQANKLRKEFPRSLDGAPMLLPGEMTVIHGELLKWFEEQQVNPRIVGEFDDSALMKAFGQAGPVSFSHPRRSHRRLKNSMESK